MGGGQMVLGVCTHSTIIIFIARVCLCVCQTSFTKSISREEKKSPTIFVPGLDVELNSDVVEIAPPLFAPPSAGLREHCLLRRDAFLGGMRVRPLRQAIVRTAERNFGCWVRVASLHNFTIV